jgi:hypothetical protein
MPIEMPRVRLFVLSVLASVCFTQLAPAQNDQGWKIHDMSRPKPRNVEPAAPSTQQTPGKAPSDAIVLFDGKDLRNWCDPDGKPSKWIVRDGAMQCASDAGNIRTWLKFGDCQLHVEWASPAPPKGESQHRGNSGVLLMGKYEVHILDSSNNATFADGYAGSLFGQYPPLVNASLPPGQWQTFDIVFTRPRFDERGNPVSEAWITLLHNGVLVQNNVDFMGPTGGMRRDGYQVHQDKLPLQLPDRGDAVRFRNIWVRELGSDAATREYALPNELLDKYIGIYSADGDMVIINRKDDLLLLGLNVGGNTIVGQPLHAESTTKFAAKSIDLQVEFPQKIDAQAMSLTFTTGGEKRQAIRVQQAQE